MVFKKNGITFIGCRFYDFANEFADLPDYRPLFRGAI